MFSKKNSSRATKNLVCLSTEKEHNFYHFLLRPRAIVLVKKWNELTDERVIVLKFYREEGESGTLNEEREANWWTKSVVRRLKSSVTTPDRPTNQVPSEDSARMKGKETEQKIPNQSVFRNTLNVSNIDTTLT